MPSIAELQHEALRKIEPWNIPSGTKLPEDLIRKICPPNGAWLLDAGCGGSAKNASLQDEYAVVGFDINPLAVKAAKANGLQFTYEADLTKIDFPGRLNLVYTYIESFGGVLAEGLLCNLVDDQPERFFKVANFFLKPGGRLYIADILQPDEAPITTINMITAREFEKLKLQWKQRYTANTQIGLPYGTFVVAKPGENKKRERGGPDELKQLVNSPDFERFARHYSVSEIYRLAVQEGFFENYFYPAVFYSREYKPLIGGIFVFEKYHQYLYTPGLADIITAERGTPEFEQAQTEFRKNSLGGASEWWRWQLQQNMERHMKNWREIFPDLSEL